MLNLVASLFFRPQKLFGIISFAGFVLIILGALTGGHAGFFSGIFGLGLRLLLIGIAGTIVFISPLKEKIFGINKRN